MKLEYIIYGVFMTVVTLIVSWTVNLLYCVVLHTSFSFETYTFFLLFAIIFIYYYNRAEDKDKEE